MKYIKTWEGWGDSLYQRPVVRAFVDLHGTTLLETPIPQLFQDLPNISFVQPDTTLRTQRENLNSLKDFSWHPAPSYPPKAFHYLSTDYVTSKNVFQAFEKSAGVTITEKTLSIPLKDEWLSKAEKLAKSFGSFAIIRPSTARQEWLNLSRNPAPGLLSTCATFTQDKGLATVGIASLGKSEKLTEVEDDYDFTLLHGEVDMFTLLALGTFAEVVVGGVGHVVPFSLFTGAKTFVVAGGYLDTDFLIDDRFDRSMIHFCKPKPFCNCHLHNHDCEKRIRKDRLIKELQRFLSVE